MIVANVDLFTWNPSDMPNINPDFMCHKLVILPQAKPIIKGKQNFDEESRATVAQEVNQLLNANFIKPIKYTTWIANVVIVKKSNDKWRMC